MIHDNKMMMKIPEEFGVEEKKYLADFNVAQMMQEFVALYAERVEQDQCDLELTISSGLPETVHNDSFALLQVLTRLLKNIIHNTNAGRVDIAVSAAGDEHIRCCFDLRYCGFGIDQETCERILDSSCEPDEFDTDIHDGAGSDTVTIRRLVESMGGEAGIDSEPEKGPLFWFTLLSRQTDTMDMARSTSQERNEDTGDSRILLVEDNPLNQEVTLEMLGVLGHRVDLVENGREALDAVKKKKYNLVFMDCRMPVMDGYEAAECIRQYEHADGDANRVPIIALTANAMPGDIKRCMHAGMDGFISKPFSIKDLELAMNRL